MSDNNKIKVSEEKSILSGEAEKKFVDDADYLKSKEIETPPEKQITITNPFTGKTTEMTLNLRGITDEKLSAILVTPELERNQKDAAIAQYLFQRGLESASFLSDLFMESGKFKKTTNAFKTQMRFDFELFAGTFVTFLKDTASAVATSLGEQRIIEDKAKLYASLKKGETIDDFYRTKYLVSELSPEKRALIHLLLRFDAESELISSQIKKVTEQRMVEKGYGVYIDGTGKAYSILDADVVKKVEEDRKEAVQHDKN